MDPALLGVLSTRLWWGAVTVWLGLHLQLLLYLLNCTSISFHPFTLLILSPIPLWQ